MAVAPFSLLTVVLTIGLAVLLSVSFRSDVAANWETYKCEPGVVPIAGAFKPATDPRTDTEFARANAAECQKEYIQDAIRLAAEVPAALASAEASTVDRARDVVDVTVDIFRNLWNFSYEAYSTFMDNMRGAAQLFTNFLIQLHGMVNRLQSAVLSIVFALISLITALVSSLQLVVIVATVITGILLALMIILFFLIAPISGLLMTMTAIISVVVISIGTAIAAATVSELFSVPGACFVPGTLVPRADGGFQTIETLPIGIRLADGGIVTAVHEFGSGSGSGSNESIVYDLHGVGVTGDHLVEVGATLVPVHEHPDARVWFEPAPESLWCLTTTTRRIVCGGNVFADWEEIPAKDYVSLRAWYQRVWTSLNKTPCDDDMVAATDLLDVDAGLDPNCKVGIPGWFGTMMYTPIKNVRVGDYVWDNTAFTRVLGRVRMEGGMSVDMVEVDCDSDLYMTIGTWVLDSQRNIWSLAGGGGIRPKKIVARHPRILSHLYTASGTFTVGQHQIRDASDVGLEQLAPLVKDIVLHQ